MGPRRGQEIIKDPRCVAGIFFGGGSGYVGKMDIKVAADKYFHLINALV
jgi:hypothetical protein